MVYCDQSSNFSDEALKSMDLNSTEARLSRSKYIFAKTQASYQFKYRKVVEVAVYRCLNDKVKK